MTDDEEDWSINVLQILTPCGILAPQMFHMGNMDEVNQPIGHFHVKSPHRIVIRP